MCADAVTAPRRRRWRGWWWKLPLLFVAFSVLQVLVLRFVDPPFSAFMVARQLDALVGQRAASDVAAGTLLSPTEVTDELVPATGESVVGVALSTGQLPAELNRPGFSGGRVLPGPAGPGGFL